MNDQYLQTAIAAISRMWRWVLGSPPDILTQKHANHAEIEIEDWVVKITDNSVIVFRKTGDVCGIYTSFVDAAGRVIALHVAEKIKAYRDK